MGGILIPLTLARGTWSLALPKASLFLCECPPFCITVLLLFGDEKILHPKMCQVYQSYSSFAVFLPLSAFFAKGEDLEENCFLVSFLYRSFWWVGGWDFNFLITTHIRLSIERNICLNPKCFSNGACLLLVHVVK